MSSSLVQRVDIIQNFRMQKSFEKRITLYIYIYRAFSVSLIVIIMMKKRGVAYDSD